MIRNPLWFPITPWPWRSLVYLATTLPAAVVFLGCLLIGPFAGVPLGAVERWRLRLVDRRPLLSPHRTLRRTASGEWFVVRIREWATWRQLLYGLLLPLLAAIDFMVVSILTSFPVVLLTLPLLRYVGWTRNGELQYVFGYRVDSPVEQSLVVVLGTVVAVACAYLAAAAATGRAMLAQLLLVGNRTKELRSRIDELRESRSRMVSAFLAERRRIERDLHDGAQQRLSSLMIRLSRLRLELGVSAGGTSDDVDELLRGMHGDAQGALQDLRDLVYGSYPEVLTGQGLHSAVVETANRSGIPVTVTGALDPRMSPEVESAAYFALCELLTNAAKHGRVTHVDVDFALDRDDLVVHVTDDGVGGADPDLGRGLVGVADRLAVVHGRLWLDSPPGGPTRIRLEVPCAL